MSYIFGQGTATTYEDLQRQRDIAKMLADRYKAAGYPTDIASGLTYFGQALAQRLARGRAERGEVALNNAAQDDFNSLDIWGGGSGGVGGGGGGSYTPRGGVDNIPPDALGVTDRDEALSFGPQMGMMPVPDDKRPMATDRDEALSFPDAPSPAAGGMEQYAAAIRTIESGSAAGDYAALGPAQENGDQALGAYQVMRSNLPQWSKHVLGREVSEAEFLASPKIQDAIFQGKFGESVAKYGNPYDAAAVWFTGQPRASMGNRADSLGTTAPAYLQKFQAALGSVGGQPAATRPAFAASAQPLQIQGNTKGVDPTLLERTAQAWGYVIPGAKIEVTTGVSSHSPVNHAPGHAIDFRITRPDGSVVQSGDPEAVQAAMVGRALGIHGIGFGPGYMGGSHMHWDISRNGPRTWGDDDGTASDRLGAGSPEIAARIAAASGRRVEDVLAELNLSAGNATMTGGGGADRFQSGAVGFEPNPNRVDMLPMSGQPTMRPPAASGGMPGAPGATQPPAGSPMDPTPNFDGALVQKLMTLMQKSGPGLSEPQRAMINAIIQREMGQQGGPMYKPPEPVKPQTMSINGRIVQVYPDGRVQEIYDSSTPEAPSAPETKDVTLPNGQKVTMQWDGQQYVPIAAPEGMPGPATEPVKPPSDVQVYEYYKENLPPGEVAMPFAQWMKAQTPQTNVTVGGDTDEYDKKRAAAFAATAEELSSAGRAAYGTMAQLDAMEGLLDDPVFVSGTGAGLIMEMRKLGQALGMDSDSVAGMETFEGLANAAALAGMGGSLGAGFSNADRDFITTQFPELAKTKGGNRLVIRALRAIEQRKIDLARLAVDHEASGGRVNAQFLQDLARYSEANPIFTDEFMRTATPPASPDSESMSLEDALRIAAEVGQDDAATGDEEVPPPAPAAFLNNPHVTDVARRRGVTPEQYWRDMMDDNTRALWLGGGQ